ncbi:MAG TPA: flagellar hook-length control protein FliK [Sideroxyarcus sp.]|nr:flagellar hook-length control protein FliK [Sideroxyarcus sp.]
MTNLPITASTPQTASVNQNTNAADAGNAQGDNAFGNVLARQIKDPAAEAKADGKSGNAATDAATDSAKPAADADSTLPADMLAALLPQVIAAASKTEPAADTTTTSSDTAIVEPTAGVVAATATAPDSTAAGIVAGTAAGVAAASVSGVTAGVTAATVNAGAPARANSESGEVRKNIPVAATGKGEEAARTRPTVSDNAAVLAKSAETALNKDSSFNAALESSAKSKVAELLTAVSRDTQAAPAAPQSGSIALTTLQNSTPAALMPAQVAVNVPVGNSRWGDEFSQKITWLATQKDQTAELHLNPPQLGPLDVVLKVSGDQATAMFTSPHAAVREAIEQAMPKLRDMLADNGITLGNTTVNDQTPRDSGSESSRQSAAGRNNGTDTAKPVAETAPRVSQISRHNGIVDTFA